MKTSKTVKKKTVQRVNVDFTVDMLTAIDAVCAQLNIHRQAWIKLRLADALALQAQQEGRQR